jgi:hypothetical protein
MEMSQGNSLCNYIKQIKVSIFFPLQNRRTEGQNRSCLRAWYQWEEEVGKGCGRVNVVQILCKHIPVQIYTGMYMEKCSGYQTLRITHLRYASSGQYMVFY